jgi:hypothetical protein
VDLNTLIPSALGLQLSEAHCVNDTGQIAAMTGGGHEVEHYYRVYLLTPP